MKSKKTQAPDPLSVTAREAVREDDEAVARAVTDRMNVKGSRSILPGPPIPPKVQAELRKQKKDD